MGWTGGKPHIESQRRPKLLLRLCWNRRLHQHAIERRVEIGLRVFPGMASAPRDEAVGTDQHRAIRLRTFGASAGQVGVETQRGGSPTACILEISGGCDTPC